MKHFKRFLPEFPRTLHIPHKPNTQRGDLIAQDADILFGDEGLVHVEEKVDGASAGIAFIDGHPVIRNRSHILKKGFLKATPAKQQFRPIWNWAHDNEHKFAKLADIMGPVTVYGEWMWAQHGMFYDLLPDWFIAYDVFHHDAEAFLTTTAVRASLECAGFSLPPRLKLGRLDNYEQLEEMTLQPTEFASDELREGVYVKVTDGVTVTHRFKMVRQGFVQGGLWSETKLQKNKLRKGNG